MVKVVAVIGTRPEAVKLWPVVEALRAMPHVETRVWVTGQHRALLEPFLERFGLRPDLALLLEDPASDVGASAVSSPAVFAGRAIEALHAELAKEAPGAVIGQGDTTTVVATALACAWARIPFVHVEAGLRSGRLDEPFPEELHRQWVARAAALHCAPTERARSNLISEGIRPERIAVTGNPVIDAVRRVVGQSSDAPRRSRSRRVLVTCHRKENQGDRIHTVCAVARDLGARGDTNVLWPVHPNPAVEGVVRRELAGATGVEVVDPLGYEAMLEAVQDAGVVLTDSGGLQEEAPGLGVPVLVLRDATERPEGVEAGCAELVGADDKDKIVVAVLRALERPMHPVTQPYGDGHSGPRIARLVAELAAKTSATDQSRAR